jgi:IS30 family transposase
MGCPTRRFITEPERQQIFDRWFKGESQYSIARSLGRGHTSIQGVRSRTGGIRPMPRTRAQRCLSLAEREEISRGIVAGRSIRSIAADLGRAASTVSRELLRNGGRRQYRANQADHAAWDRAHRPKTCKLAQNRALARIVAQKLQLELIQHLRKTRAMRRSQHHTQKTSDHGSNNSQIATLVERHTRYVMLVRVNSKDTKTVINALIKHAHKLPRELYKSLTWDRGKEMAEHERFSLATDIKVYFCDPQHPWQRGSNENTNGLLRQYFPKGMDLSNVHQNRLNAVARRLNERPREKLQFYSPAEKLGECVASTG